MRNMIIHNHSLQKRMKHSIELIWHRDTTGYKILSAIPANPKATIALSRETPERIVANGGKKIAYRPLEKHPCLFSEFAEIKQTARGVLAFVNKYGRLKGFGNYDPVPEILQAAQDMKLLLRKNNSRAVKVQNIRFNSTLDFDAQGKPSLILSPKTLLDGLWLQLGESLADGRTSSAMCLQCQTRFLAGPGTGRRLDAKFCSDEHRVLYNSRNRKGRK